MGWTIAPFAQLHDLIESTLRFSTRATYSYNGVSRVSVADQKKVSGAIVAGDPACAEAAMQELIEEALHLIRTRIEKSG